MLSRDNPSTTYIKVVVKVQRLETLRMRMARKSYTRATKYIVLSLKYKYVVLGSNHDKGNKDSKVHRSF